MLPPVLPPHDLDELAARVRALEGRTLSELEAWLARPLAGPSARRKGKTGELIERALGALSGSAPGPDFPHLGVELKTIPIDAQGRAQESTYVCTMPLSDAEHAEWSHSHVRAKLSHVLFVPLIDEGSTRRVGEPLFWQPSAEQEAVLRADFDDIVGLVAIGKIEHLDARLGRWLQARPKAAHSRVRARAYGPEGEPLAALPRGFYLRARFTSALLRDPHTLLGGE